MSELLPCPFCGCEAEIIKTKSIHDGDLFGIMCKYCCSRGDFHRTKNQAIDAWNSRVEQTCKLVETDRYTNSRETIHVLECTKCGKTCEHVNGIYPRCPHCGEKVSE